MRHLGLALAGGAALLGALVAATESASASAYSPPGLYEVEHFVLANGLRVVLKPRDAVKAVSFRLVVEAGFSDFPCGRRETPHFLEHLLFAGTSRHDEAELDALIESNGGTWNATTGDEDTIYELDIYSEHAALGLETLHEIVTDSALAPADVEDARDVIHRESGGRPSRLRTWLYRRGVGKSAFTKAMERLYPGQDLVCPDLETAEHITRDDILSARDRFYVPGNMTLIVVGDFDRGAIGGQIEDTFARIEPGAEPPPRPNAAEPPPGRVTVTGTLAPIVDRDASVGLMFRTAGYSSPDYYPLLVLAEYLDTRLFETLRIEAALAYEPAVDRYAWQETGALVLSADVDIDATGSALAMIEEALGQVREAPLDLETLEATKRGILMTSVWALESNADVADYYAASYRELEDRGALIDEEAEIERVTPADLHRLANQYLRADQGVAYRSAPTLTGTEVLAAAALVVLVLSVAVFRLQLRGRRSVR